MKFKIDGNGFYAGYGTDGTVDMTKTYNLENLPIACRYTGSKWVKDEDKYNEIIKEDVLSKLEYHKKMTIILESQLENL